MGHGGRIEKRNYAPIQQQRCETRSRNPSTTIVVTAEADPFSLARHPDPTTLYIIPYLIYFIMSGMLAPEDENDAEVRREDQIHINKFARLNARLHELRSDLESLKVRTFVMFQQQQQQQKEIHCTQGCVSLY
jgi:hypothetical protein